MSNLKRAKSYADWQEQVEYYAANGSFPSNVRRPKKNSEWGKKVEKIDKCPKKRKAHKET